MPTRSWAHFGLVALACGCASLASVRAHRELTVCDALRGHDSASYAIDAAWRKRLGGTYRAMLADTFYLRAVNVFGTKSEHKRGYPTLPRLLWAASCLDAKFIAPYLMAGTALMSVPAHTETALRLLERGSRERPDIWLIPFFYAFELFDRGRWAEAAPVMSIAAQAHDAPPFVASLAARLAADSGAPALAVRMLESLLLSTPDDDTRAFLLERKRALLWQQQRDAWQRAVKAYGRAHALTPRLIDVWQALPEAQRKTLVDLDPWGAPFVLEDGEVTSENAHRQLHVHQQGEAL